MRDCVLICRLLWGLPKKSSSWSTRVGSGLLWIGVVMQNAWSPRQTDWLLLFSVFFADSWFVSYFDTHTTHATRHTNLVNEREWSWSVICLPLGDYRWGFAGVIVVSFRRWRLISSLEHNSLVLVYFVSIGYGCWLNTSVRKRQETDNTNIYTVRCVKMALSLARWRVGEKVGQTEVSGCVNST